MTLAHILDVKVRKQKKSILAKGEQMVLFAVKDEEKSYFFSANDKEETIIKWLEKKHCLERVVDISQLKDEKFVVRTKHYSRKKETHRIIVLPYVEYCKKFQKELAENTPCFNRANAWRYFYPEGGGKAKKGYALHHKDERLRHDNRVRYNMWLPDDLEMMTRSEHQRHHTKERMLSKDERDECRKRMLDNTYNRGKRWFNNGIVNVRAFEAPEGFVEGQLRKPNSVRLKAVVPKTKPIEQFDMDGNFIRQWESMAEASRQLAIHLESIWRCVNNKQKTTGGFVWKYAS